MTYIEYLKAFWRYNRLNPFTSNEISMYTALLEECNEQFWPTSFRMPPGFFKKIISRYSRNIIDVRQKLIDKGFITYEIIDGVGYYSILEREGPSSGNPTRRGRGKRKSTCNTTAENAPISCPEDHHADHPEDHPEDHLNDHPEDHLNDHPEDHQNANLTYYIEYKDKDKDKDKDMCMCKNDSKKSDTHTVKQIVIPEVESTYWRYRNETTNYEYRKFLEYLEIHAPYVATHLLPLTENQFHVLHSTYGTRIITKVVSTLENRRDLCQKYSNMYFTFKAWCKNEEKFA